jgi:hypothetical protein
MVTMTAPSGQILDFGDASQEEMLEALNFLDKNTDILKEPPSVGAPLDRPFELTEAPRIDAPSRQEQQRRKIAAGTEAEEEFPITHEGEVRDASFQFWFGRADTDSDREKRLTSEFGEESWKKLGYNDYALILDNISPEQKQELGLPDSGTIRVNEPGFSRYDLAAAAGAEAVPLGMALGVGMMFSGVGLVPGMALMAAAGAAGKGIDEFLVEDYMEGLQTQSDDEVYGDMLITGVAYGLGEAIGRGAFALGRRLLKGKGPIADPARITALTEEIAKRRLGTDVLPENFKPSGGDRSLAARIGREEAKATLRGAVKEGAAPTIETATQKAITGRLQSIYEGIFPNRTAAEKNLTYMKDKIKKLVNGEITEAEFKASLDQQASAISALISNTMKTADVDAAEQLAQQHLRQVISKELDLITDLYNPNQGLSANLQQSMNSAARMFEQESSELYAKSENLLKIVKTEDGFDLATFGEAPLLQRAVKDIEADEATKAVAGDAFNKGLFDYIKGKVNRPEIDPKTFKPTGRTLEPDNPFTLTELTSLRSALRAVNKDPNLMPGITDRHIGKLTTAVDDTIKNHLAAFAQRRVVGAPHTIDARIPDNLSPEMLKAFEDGVRALKKADKNYSEGIQRFNAGAVDMLEQNIRSKFFLGNKPILESIVEPGNHLKLQAYLKAVTPAGKSISAILNTPPSVFKEAGQAALRGDVEGANLLLRRAGISEKAIPKLPEFINNLAKQSPKDPYIMEITREFNERMLTYADYATRQASPLTIRNSVRDSVAREWLDQTSRISQKTLGTETVLDGVAFGKQFRALGEPLQNTMFGKANAQAMRNLIKDWDIMGFTQKELSKRISNTLAQPGVFGRRAPEAVIREAERQTLALRTEAEKRAGVSLKEVLDDVAKAFEEAEVQSQSALYRAVESGNIENADQLVNAVLKNKKNYDLLWSKAQTLAREGDTSLLQAIDGPLGVKDMAMSRIVSAAFPEGITADAVAAGTWGRPMRQMIAELNSNGSLSAMIGQKTINDLIDLSKIGELISSKAFAGKAGLAPAAFAGAAMMRLLTSPLSFMGEAAGVFVMGRVLRQGWFLESMLKPNYRAGIFDLTGGRKAYRKGLVAGAKLDTQNPVVMELRERVYQQARLILSTGASDLFEEGERLTEEAIGDVTQSMQPAPIDQTPPVVPPALPAPAPDQPPAAVTPGQMTAAVAPDQMTAADVERQRVMNQLAGLPA